MAQFVGRNAESKLIDDAIETLLKYKKDLLRTPIVNFYGIEGIGKTFLLEEIKMKCDAANIVCIMVDKCEDECYFVQKIVDQVKHSAILHADPLQQATLVLQELLAQNVAVILVDAIDTTNEKVIAAIAKVLREVIDEDKLFVVLASRRKVSFDSERLLTRKLTSVQLKAIDQESCEVFLRNVHPRLKPEFYASIYEWTWGYPWAMEVMVQAVLNHDLDPRKSADQSTLLNLIFEHVIRKRILDTIKAPFLDECQMALPLLSMPRRFNLVIMQNLIKRFESRLEQESGQAYVALLRRLSQKTNILTGNGSQSDFSVNPLVRHMFLLKNKIEQPEHYLIMHSFLADLNKGLADDVPGFDSIRYLREYLYHQASIPNQQDFPLILERTLLKICNETFESVDRFREEFVQDKELQKAFGEYSNVVLSLVDDRLANNNR